MAKKHIWYYLKNDEGQPIKGADINVYLTGTTTEATVYQSQSASASYAQSNLVTDADGYFDFWIADQFTDLPVIGYQPSQYFDIIWSSPSGSGILDNVQLFDLIYPVDETDNDDEKNKMLSNQLAYDFTRHVDLLYPTKPHEIYPVDETDPSDGTFNKVINNELLNRMYNLPLASGGLTVSTSGALLTTSILYASGFTPSGDYVAATFDPQLFRVTIYPIVQVYKKDAKEMIIPADIKSIGSSTIAVIVASGTGDLIATALGQVYK